MRVDHRSLAGAVVLALLALADAAPIAPSSPMPPDPAAPRELRYDLRAGDRLVYRETLHRESVSEHASSAVDVEWTSEVMVTGAGREGVVVGIQRRRLSAELVRASENRKDTLARERAGFAEQVARQRPAVLPEANVFDALGQPRLDVQAQREWTSELLPLVHEIVALPSQAVAPGQSWHGGAPLALDFRAEAWEDVAGERCLRLRGALPAEQVVLRAWFCAALGALRRLELVGRYPGVGRELRETLRFELLERVRGESLARWLEAPERRRGVLAALLLADGLTADTRQLEALLRLDDDALRLETLALLWRRRVPIAFDVIAPLAASPNARVRTLAVRVLESAPTARARPLIEAALGDSQLCVREAALLWLRQRLPPERALALHGVSEAGTLWNALSDARRDGPESLAPLAADVQAGRDRADWRCDEAGNWAQAALRDRRVGAEPPGVRLSIGTQGAARGQPYVVRVPEDYRGDEPVPLLLYLSGGPGRALTGWSTASRALAPTGYLAVFPQASGLWWDAGSERLVSALLDEILERYNVDPNRVYVAGFSNGGTGALRYAALWPDRFAAAVSLMGAGQFVEGGEATPLAGVGRLPLLFVHGERDQVIPSRASEETVATLRGEARGAQVELRLLPGREHDLVLDDDGGLTLPFLERWRREPFPREVTFALADLRAPRRYWIEVLEREPGTARVEGRISSDGVIELKTRNVRRLRLLLRRELLAPAGELRVRLDGREAWRGTPQHDCALLQRTWRETRDPFRAWSLEIPLTTGHR